MNAATDRRAGALAALLVGAPLLGVAAANAAVAVALAWLIWRWTRPERPRLRRPVPTWLWALGLYVLVRLLTALASPEPLVSLRYVLKEWRLAALLAGAAGLLAPLPAGWGWLAACAGANLLVAGLQLSPWLGYLPDGLQPYTPTRVGSFLGQPMTEGGVGMVLLLGVWLWPLSRRARWTLALLAAAILGISLTRSAWLGALIGGAVLLILLEAPRRIWFGLAGLLGGLSLLPQVRHRFTVLRYAFAPARTVGRRFALWREAWHLGNERWWAGIGPGRFQRELLARADLPPEGSTVHAHSVPFHLLAEGGWPTLLAWGAWMGTMATALWRGRRRTPALAVLVATLVAGLFELNLYDSEFAILCFFLLGHGLHVAGAGPWEHSEEVP